MKNILKLGILTSTITFVACGSIYDKNIAYKIKQPVKPLEYPPSLISNNPQNLESNTWSGYVLNQSSDVDNKILPNGKMVQWIRKDATTIWLLSDKAPNILWGDLKQFLIQLAGTNILKENKSAGLLSIQSVNAQDKVTIRLEKTPNATRIFVSYYNKPINKSTDIWKRDKIYYELEAEILARLMAFLNINKQNIKTKITKIANDRVKLITNPQGLTILLALEPFANIWRRTNNILKELGIEITDLDRNAGIFYIRYVEANENAKSIFSSSENKKDYKIILAATDNKTHTTITIQENQQVSNNNAIKQLTSILHQQLK